jgi:putative Holliday junction resolvase
MNDISSSNKAADAAFSSTFSSAENAAARPAAAPAPQKPEVPAHFQQFLGFDFGIKRTGCASGNRVLGGANPLPTIKAEGRMHAWPRWKS